MLIGISSSIDSAFERSPGSLLLHTTPLLEEKWDPGPQTLIPDVRDPFLQNQQIVFEFRNAVSIAHCLFLVV
jgi:hypothetical protein